MKRVLEWLMGLGFRFLLSLRYKIHLKGFEKIVREKGVNEKGILFLANHPAEIDPCILLTILWPRFRPHPVAIDYLFHIPLVRYFLDFVGALPVPNFDGSSNSFKRKQIEKTYKKISLLLTKKENLLIYPAGGLKHTNAEVIGGASGVHTILQRNPDVNVVLIKSTGLWGSSFSKALTGKTPNLIDAFLNGFKILLRNFIFFVPKREVWIEFELASSDFPKNVDKRTLNKFLENWYNHPVPEPLKLVSYSFWKEAFPKVHEKPKQEEDFVEKVSPDVIHKVLKELSELTQIPIDKMKLNDDLAMDLGLDSLDLAQILVMLRDQFGVTGVHSSDLITVRSVVLAATKQLKSDGEEETLIFTDKKGWKEEHDRPPIIIQGKLLPEIFLNTCNRLKRFQACVDNRGKILSYSKLKIGTLLLAEEIKKLPGEKIGILMPASIPVYLLVLATMLARKVPVMINWTLGPRNLRSVLEQSKIEITLSSWNFLNHLENVDLDGLDDQIILVEEMFRSLTVAKKFTAFCRGFLSTKTLLKKFGSASVSETDPAAILFTSGTESVPKGVPLSHANLRENQQGAFKLVNVQCHDVMLGALPPFHSFGFSVTGLLPLLGGLRVVYTPNPTDGKKIASLIEEWKVTLLCLAPTFLKNVLRAATLEQLTSLQLVVTGAEKTPHELYEKMKELNPNSQMIEGYGITECAPILTLNIPHEKIKGVGRPLPGVEIMVVHPESFEEVGHDVQGLILAKGPNVFSGYLDATLSSPFVEKRGQKWYVTGDLGYLDKDNYLTLTGRYKRFIKIGGEMVSLAAVEEVLIAAAKLHTNTSSFEQIPLAVCAVEEEGKKTEMHLFTTIAFTAEDVNHILRENGLSNLIKIRSVHHVSFIPLLGSGKVDYRRLSMQLSQNLQNAS